MLHAIEKFLAGTNAKNGYKYIGLQGFLVYVNLDYKFQKAAIN
jgi:hypothetical protein